MTPVFFFENVMRRAKNKLRSMFLQQEIHSQKTYSQCGEDIILNSLVGNKDNGFYVDIGAHHPFRFSNTCAFYKRGWRGINIDAMPGSMVLFNKYRTRDINLEIGVSDIPGELEYFIYDEPALNTFSVEKVLDRASPRRNIQHSKSVKIRVETLEEILDKHLPVGTRIDFMSIDVEGHDEAVLRSNNWNKYRPQIVAAETFHSKLSTICSNSLVKVMEKIEYEPVSFSAMDIFFRDSRG